MYNQPVEDAQLKSNHTIKLMELSLKNWNVTFYSKWYHSDEAGCYITFGHNNKGRIMREWNIGNQHKTQIKNVLYVDGLNHNLLSISQICDRLQNWI